MYRGISKDSPVYMYIQGNSLLWFPYEIFWMWHLWFVWFPGYKLCIFLVIDLVENYTQLFLIGLSIRTLAPLIHVYTCTCTRMLYIYVGMSSVFCYIYKEIGAGNNYSFIVSMDIFFEAILTARGWTIHVCINWFTCGKWLAPMPEATCIRRTPPRWHFQC